MIYYPTARPGRRGRNRNSGFAGEGWTPGIIPAHIVGGDVDDGSINVLPPGWNIFDAAKEILAPVTPSTLFAESWAKGNYAWNTPGGADKKIPDYMKYAFVGLGGLLLLALLMGDGDSGKVVLVR